VLKEITDCLEKGETVKLSSFGSFMVRKKGQRIGRNPKTGTEVPISPRRVMVFKPSAILKQRIKSFEAPVVDANEGVITSVSDGIARVYGLEQALAGELLDFPGPGGRGTVLGLALDLREDSVGVVIMGPFEHLQEGDTVRTTALDTVTGAVVIDETTVQDVTVHFATNKAPDGTPLPAGTVQVHGTAQDFRTPGTPLDVATLEQRLHRLSAPHAAGDLELDVRSLEHARDHWLVAGGPSCRVEVDDVNSLRAGGSKSHCHLNRVLCIYRRLVVLALRQAHAATAKDVNRGDDDHLGSLAVIRELQWDGDVLRLAQRLDHELQRVLVFGGHAQLVTLDSHLRFGGNSLNPLAKVSGDVVSDPGVQSDLDLAAALADGLRVAGLEELR